MASSSRRGCHELEIWLQTCWDGAVFAVSEVEGTPVLAYLVDRGRDGMVLPSLNHISQGEDDSQHTSVHVNYSTLTSAFTLSLLLLSARCFGNPQRLMCFARRNTFVLVACPTPTARPCFHTTICTGQNNPSRFNSSASQL